MSALATRNLPAAVIEEGAPGSKDIIKVIPTEARRLRVGKAILGYRIPGGWNRLATIRLHEIERIISLRYGPGGCDTDDGVPYAILAAHTLIPRLIQAQVRRAKANVEQLHDLVCDRFAGWCAAWLPELSSTEVRRVAETAIAEPRLFRADTAARLIRLTMTERAAANVTTIGAFDCSAEERKRLRLEMTRRCDRRRKEELRRAAGCRTREEVHATSVVAQCKAMGISRTTYYRWLKAGKILPPTERNTSDERHTEPHPGARGKCPPPPAAKPQPPSRREPFRYYHTPSARPTAPEPEPRGRRASLAARRDAPPDDREDLTDEEWAWVYARSLSA